MIVSRLAAGVGAEHLAGEAAVGLAEAFGQIRRGSKGEGAGEAGDAPLAAQGEERES